MPKLFCLNCEQELNLDTVDGHQLQGHYVVAIFAGAQNEDTKTAKRTATI